MLKNILNLEGAQKLTRNEQKSINGGVACSTDASCGIPPEGTVYRCIKGVCKLELLP